MAQKWNLTEMQNTLVRDTEKKIEEGFEDIKTQTGGQAPCLKTDTGGQAPCLKNDEPTKGVQTNIPMSVYRQLTEIKLTRGETIGTLVGEAITFWLQHQTDKL